MSVAPWFQEEVRRELEKRFGAEQVHEAGLKVETTLDLDLQKTANHAVADGLAAYERRHGWKNKLRKRPLHRRHHRGLPPSRLGRHHPPRRIRPRRCNPRPAPRNPRPHRPPGQPDSNASCPKTGNGPASAMATPSSNPATSSTSISPTRTEGTARRATLQQDSGAQGVTHGHRQHQRRRPRHGRRPRLRALRSSTAPPRPSARPAPASSPTSTPPPSRPAQNPPTSSSTAPSASAATPRTTTRTTTKAQ